MSEKEVELMRFASLAVVTPTRELIEWRLASLIEECGSPIERLMLLGLVSAFWPGYTHLDIVSPQEAMRIAGGRDSIEVLHLLPPKDPSAIYVPHGEASIAIELQRQIESFRVDFLVSMVREENDRSQEPIQLVIECDGHDFHEKTKEQARKDKSRDRELKMLGYEVFRFAGSEIWASASQCAYQAVEFIDSRHLAIHHREMSASP